MNRLNSFENVRVVINIDMEELKQIIKKRLEMEEKVSSAPWDSTIRDDKDGSYSIDTGIYYPADKSGAESDQCILDAEFLEQMRNEYRSTNEALLLALEALESLPNGCFCCCLDDPRMKGEHDQICQSVQQAHQTLKKIKEMVK